MTCEEKARKWDETQERLTKLADRLEKSEIFIHRNLEDLPEAYVSTVGDYLAAVANGIKVHNQVREWEEKYEKGRGELFDALHRIDELEASQKYTGVRT